MLQTLLDSQFQAISVPLETGVAKERIAEYTAKQELVNKEIQEVSTDLDSRKGNYAGFLAACEELLSIHIEKAEAPLRFATTDHAFIAEGWVPKNSVGTVTEGIIRTSAGKAFVTELPVEEEKDVVPVEYDNVSFARPSQLLMDTYSRPRYTELDPTLVVAIIYPIFFGLILGEFPEPADEQIFTLSKAVLHDLQKPLQHPPGFLPAHIQLSLEKGK